MLTDDEYEAEKFQYHYRGHMHPPQEVQVTVLIFDDAEIRIDNLSWEQHHAIDMFPGVRVCEY